jgi:hypothetical protein
MSGPGKGARPCLRPEKQNPDGTLRDGAFWVVREWPCKISTGCPTEDRASAKRAVGKHLLDKYKPNHARVRDPSEILIADDYAFTAFGPATMMHTGAPTSR